MEQQDSIREAMQKQIDALKSDNSELGKLTTQDELDSAQYFVDNYDKFCYPIKKGSNGKEILLQGEKQHKVPKVLLKGFSNGENGLYQYDITTGNLSDIPLGLNNLLTEEDIYVLLEKDGKRSYIFEKFIFSYLLEGNIGGVVKKIQNKEKLLPRDWQILSGFVSYQYVRTDSFIKNIQESFEESAKVHSMYGYDTFEQFEQRIGLIQRKTGKDFGDVRKLYDFMKSGEYDVSVQKQSIMKDVLHFGNMFREAFLNGNYEVLETRKSDFFIISDNPFFIIPPKGWRRGDGVGLLFPPSAEKIIPINQKQCLRIWLNEKSNPGVSMGYRTINHKETTRINQYICKNASRFILCKDRLYLSNLIKTIDFKKVNEEKTYNKFYYDKGFKIHIQRQLFPL